MKTTLHGSALARSLLIGALLLAGTTGCSAGPRLLDRDYPVYNQTIRDLEDEHMLLNLVRMRYFETPVFLQIASISTSYGVSVGTDVSGTTASGGGNSLTAGASAGYSETPTITYSLPDSREFFGRMLAPLSSEQVSVIATSGGGTPVLRMGIQKLNGLSNLDNYDEWEITTPQSYGDFGEALDLIVDLQRQGLLDFGYAWDLSEASSPFEDLDSRAIPEAEKLPMEFYRNDDGNWVAYSLSTHAQLRFAPASDQSPAAQRLRELLGLDPALYIFPVTDANDAATEKARKFSGGPPAALDPTAVYSELVVQNRSMMEILWYASHSVEVPPEHLGAGIATEPADSLEGLLRVQSSPVEPVGAAVKVEYEGYWFFIPANDLRSRATLLNLNVLFAVTGGTVPGGKPVLTLPVR